VWATSDSRERFERHREGPAGLDEAEWCGREVGGQTVKGWRDCRGIPWNVSPVETTVSTDRTTGPRPGKFTSATATG